MGVIVTVSKTDATKFPALLVHLFEQICFLFSVFMLEMSSRSHSGKREKCFLCDLPKAAWTILADFSEQVCRGCVNYEGVDRVEDAIEQSKRLRHMESSALGSVTGSYSAKRDVHGDGKGTDYGGVFRNGGAAPSFSSASSILDGANGGVRSIEHPLDDFASSVSPYGADSASRGYGGGVRVVDMNGAYSAYGHMGGMDYTRAGFYSSDGGMSGNFYSGWRAAKRSMPVDDWYYPSRPTPSMRRVPPPSRDFPSYMQSSSAAKRTKESSSSASIDKATPGKGVAALRGSGTKKPGEANGSDKKVVTVVTASPDSHTAPSSSDGDKSRHDHSKPIDKQNAASTGSSSIESSVSTTTSSGHKAESAQSDRAGNSLSLITTTANEQNSPKSMPTPPADLDQIQAASMTAEPVGPNTPILDAGLDPESTSAEKTCLHCGCLVSAVQYVQCPSVEKHRYCLFCTFMHIEWADAGSVTCPSKQRCLHPNTDTPWVFLPDEIDSIKQFVQLTDTPSLNLMDVPD